MPWEAIRGARQQGGATVGISPYPTRAAHQGNAPPIDFFDVIQLTRLPPAQRGQNVPNFMGREIDNIQRSDAIVIAGGSSGTLGEFALAVEFRRPIGVLLRTGGVTPHLKALVRAMRRVGRKPKAPVLFDTDPIRLVRRLEAATVRERASSEPAGEPRRAPRALLVNRLLQAAEGTKTGRDNGPLGDGA
jgi:hypothetical protein